MATCVLAPEQFTCSICLDVFSSPVTIPCGHNFCRGCIQTYWTKGEQSCPLCLRAFPQIPELAVNHILGALVTSLRGDEPKPAQTVALIKTSPPKTFQADNPQQPTQGDDVALCDKHGEALSLFCLEEKTLLCNQCTSKSQRIVPAVEQIPLIKQMLLNEKFTTMNSAHAVKMELLKARTTMESYEESVTLQKEELETDFAVLFSALNDVKKRAMASMEEKERGLLQKAARRVEEMEEAHKGLEDELTQMDLSLKSGDPHKLLQTYNAVQRSSRGATNPSDCEVLEEKLVQPTDIKQQLINEVEKVWKGRGSVTAKALDIHFAASKFPWSALEKYKETLTLDASTASRYVWVSPDRTEACSSYPVPQPEPRDSEGVKSSEVRATQCFTGGRHFWEVRFPKTEGYLGCFGVKNKSGQYSLTAEIESNPKGSLVNVYLSGKRVESVMHQSQCSTFGVYLDYDSGILCIYSPEGLIKKADLVYAFTTNFGQYSLFPVFEVRSKSRMVLL